MIPRIYDFIEYKMVQIQIEYIFILNSNNKNIFCPRTYNAYIGVR